MIWVLWYLVIGIATSGFVSQKAILRILSYNKGETVLVSGTSKVHAKERAQKAIENYTIFKEADSSKFSGLLVGGFIGTVIAWPASVYMSVMYREHVRIQNGVLLD